VKLILVVDDEPHIMKLLSFSLTSHGYDVIEATDGLTAVELAKDRQPDLILLDIMMPALNGYDACRRIKADPSTADIPVFMLTAKTQATEKAAGAEAGANDYICKPFTPRDLVARVEAFFAEGA
jgi:two-component system, OmpR family, alkaline phosphatase synthesis response regulator PhoP